MKKFILLFTVVLMGIASTQAQEISRLLGKTGFQPTYINLETDTFKHTAALNTISMTFAVEFTNGNTPLDSGNIIVLDGFIGGSAIANDSLKYELKANLGAGESIVIDISTEAMGSWSNKYPPGLDTTTFAFLGRVYYTTKFNVDKQKQATVVYVKTQTTNPPAIMETEIQVVKLYPNPVNSDLNIVNLKNTKVEIFNVVGQRIFNLENANGDVNINMVGYPNGIYFVKMQNGKSVRTEKIKLVK